MLHKPFFEKMLSRIAKHITENLASKLPMQKNTYEI